jgi:DNA-binding NarL/FixJ family response regulator
MQTPNMPILLANAHTFSRIGLYQVLADAGFKIAREVNNVEELGQQLNGHTAPFLLLLAGNLLPKKPIPFILELCQKQPDCHIVLLLNNYQHLPLPVLVDAGVTGMVAKMESTQTLVQIIQTAAAGQSAISPMVMATMLQPDSQPEIILEASEEQLLQLVCAEKTNPEIAVDLHTSPKTVERRLSVLYGKLQVRSRVGAAVWFCQHKNGVDTSTGQ